MNNFFDIKSKFSKFQDDFSNTVKDHFGSSIINEGLYPVSQNIDSLVMQEEKIKLETINIQKNLIEAKSIFPDLGA